MGKLVIFGDQNLVTGFTRNPILAFKELLSAPKYNPMALMSANKSIMGYHLGKMKGAENKIKRSINALNVLIEQKKITPIIDKIFSYKNASAAHQYMQERKNFGKVLIDFSDIK